MRDSFQRAHSLQRRCPFSIIRIMMNSTMVVAGATGNLGRRIAPKRGIQPECTCEQYDRIGMCHFLEARIRTAGP
jgi:hypothetical protein